MPNNSRKELQNVLLIVVGIAFKAFHDDGTGVVIGLTRLFRF